jgi:hypothetical protein
MYPQSSLPISSKSPTFYVSITTILYRQQFSIFRPFMFQPPPTNIASQYTHSMITNDLALLLCNILNSYEKVICLCIIFLRECIIVICIILIFIFCQLKYFKTNYNNYIYVNFESKLITIKKNINMWGQHLVLYN